MFRTYSWLVALGIIIMGGFSVLSCLFIRLFESNNVNLPRYFATSMFITLGGILAIVIIDLYTEERNLKQRQSLKKGALKCRPIPESMK